MIQISNDDIARLGISPATCMAWVREALLMKGECQLPAKSHVTPQGNDFITTMPCLLPPRFGRFGVKVVSRVKGRHPALSSRLMLMNSQTSDIIAMMDADWITTMRTGAVAALAIQTFRREGAAVYGFIGLGVTARATMTCLVDALNGEHLQVRLLRYKDQAERFAADFAHCENVTFTIVDTADDLVDGADVVVSCVTEATELIVPDERRFKRGVLLVPVHTRGFQNCDAVFDRVFADDTAHVQSFRYFSQFRNYAEMADVLRGENPGRQSQDERILSYNVGIALHDVYFAHQITALLLGQTTLNQSSCNE